MRVALNESLERFVEHPCELGTVLVDALLSELCVQFGYCLAPAAHESIVASAPTTPLAFAERVVELELGHVDPDGVRQILPTVLATFEGARTASVSKESR